jgi:pimeloyl-ACP methyl ester carboxylesterase
MAGHSFAGQEMTRFVRTYPGRVIKLVYLDGAFDGIAYDSVLAKLPPPPVAEYPVKQPLTDADTLTADAYVKYVHRTRGVKIPEGDIRVRMSHDGIIEEIAPPYQAIAAEGGDAPNWSTLPVPALAIFAFTDSVSQAEPWIREQPRYARAVQAAYNRSQPLNEILVRSFLRAPGSKALVIRGGHHWVFVSHREEVVRAMRDWLLAP